MKLRDLFYLSAHSVRKNGLRTVLTIAIIAFGIMAIVGIFTAIESIRSSIYDNFASMGANGFTIRNRDQSFQIGGDQVRKGNRRAKGEKKVTSRRDEPIDYREAEAFKDKFQFPATVSLSVSGVRRAVVFHQDEQTDPNVQILGGDENYLKINGYTLAQGHNFSSVDVNSGQNVAIIGMDVAKKLFGPSFKNIEGQFIRIEANQYRIIGVLQPKGSSNIFSGDNMVLTTPNNIRRIYGSNGSNFEIGVEVHQATRLNEAVGEAIGTFRTIRKLDFEEANNFFVIKNDNLAHVLMNSLGNVRIAALFIGIITLFGSAIGLMNIMLVAVAERTREIGVSKALGAQNQAIRRQFLYEAVFISLIGGALGIFFGIMIGNVVSILMKTSFVIPWLMIAIAVVVCALVGISSGLYPAIKAARLDPIIALRHE